MLHVFGYGSDGSYPGANLIWDKKHNLYGTTIFGGKYNGGAVFEFAADGTETVLHSFAGGAVDGAYPHGTLLQDAAGNLYGTTNEGGSGTCNCGIVFELPRRGREKILHAFTAAGDGAYPFSTLVSDPSGNMYGTTAGGGTIGKGTVFKITPDGTESVLYSFTSASGATPYGGPILDGQGNIYGTTYAGANGNCQGGCGSVYKLAPDGTESTLHAFTNGSDGAYPATGLLLHNGKLYGTAYGDANDGTVFELPH